MKCIVLLMSFIALSQCGPVSQDESVLKQVIGNFVNCMNSDLSLCLKEHALRATERLGTVRQLKIYDGVTILNNNPKEAKSLENLSSEPEIRKQQITERLWKTSSELVQNSDLELSFEGDEEESRALGEIEEGRGKKKEVKKKMKMLMPLMMLAKAKAIALAVLFLGIIALAIFKLAVIAKIAFIVKAIAIIKALILAKKNQEEHQVAWVPHEEHAHAYPAPAAHGWEGGWARQAQNLAYSAYAQ